MFTTPKELIFFFAEIDKNKKVLEYGSGQSTIEIASICNSIVSIEHQEEWYDKNIPLIPNNCEIILKKPNLPYIEGGHCGTYNEFRDYIEAPLSKGPFDVILIDGRARVACASICHKLCHENTIIFVHDFHRKEYQEILKYFDMIDIVETMGKFKIKK
jgi:predicted O-methyltransferase YrrM